MLGITLKRSVATLGVVAGLLAAAAPVHAKPMADDSWHGASTPREPARTVTCLDQDLNSVRAGAVEPK